MAKKISDLTALGTTPASGDLIPLVDDSASATKYVTYSDFIGTTLLITMFQGCLQRSKFEYSTTTAILIGAGWYEHNGTAQQMLYWNSQLTYTFGSGGSNANSDDLGASEWHYLYIDDSELSGATMAAGEFINTTTAPAWSETKHGYYNGNDRCIGAFLTNASSEIIEFYHDGGDQVFFADMGSSIDQVTETTWTDVDLSSRVPGFSTKASAIFESIYDANSTRTKGYWRTNGQSGSTGHGVTLSRRYSNGYAYYYDQMNTLPVLTDGSQIIECKMSNSDGSMKIYVDGYFFPRGM